MVCHQHIVAPTQDTQIMQFCVLIWHNAGPQISTRILLWHFGFIMQW